MLVFVKKFPWLLVSFLVRSFSYISRAGSIQLGVSPTHLMLCLFMRSFSYTHDASFSEEFLLHTSCYVYLWGVSLTHLMLYLFVRSFSYTPDTMFIREEFLLHSWYYVYLWGVSLTFLMLVLVRNFSYTPRAGFSEEFLLHSSSWF